MSCTVPKLLSYYSDKINIYKSDSFIIVPAWRTCPPPSIPIIGPSVVVPYYGPIIPPMMPQNVPKNNGGACCDSCSH